MMRIFINVGLFILSSFLFFSCENEDVHTPSLRGDENSLAFDKEIACLENFNDSVLQLNSQTRSGGRLWATVAADALSVSAAFRFSVWTAAGITALTGGTAGPLAAVGVFAGTAFLSGGASYAAYRSITTCSIIVPVTESNLYLGNCNKSISTRRFREFRKKYSLDIESEYLPLQKDSVYADIGELHNNLVLAALNQKQLTRSTVPEENPVEYPEDEEYQVNSYGMSLFSDEDVQSMSLASQERMAEFYETNDYEALLANFRIKGYISTEMGIILKLFCDVLNGYVTTGEEMSVVLAKYETIVKTSPNITDDDKNILMMTLEIARYSFSLWNNNFKY